MPDSAPFSPEFKVPGPEVVRSLPKVLLHDHLDGGLRPATLLELAAEAGVTPPADSEERLTAWVRERADSGSLEDYLTVFDEIVKVLQTGPAITRVTREALEDLAADNVVYAELRAAPELHTAGDLSLREVVDAIKAGMDVPGIEARLILCAMRQNDSSEEIAELVVANAGETVVGFDLAGPEDGYPASNHAAALTRLRESFVPATVHAGEDAGVDSIASAVLAGANRLGHGARIFEDFTVDEDGIALGKVASWVRDRRIPLELAPSSNVQTGLVDDLADHPFPLLQQLGFVCTVNTDNRLVSNTTLSEEMSRLVDYFDYGLDELFQLTVNALNGAFIPEPLRQDILARRILPAYEELADPDYRTEGD
ncbi:adenosine deaminase [Corynebacterium otitidis]|uniref:adenosine deaminase n=1 Tax=Corynebacterium otitidis ATCC 51513 TaxID=883169 RepID=I7IXC3_9CORY|nr:adenosine deaminase [Corynebacterium otitidis]EJZ81882.1 adenosine deaminase [Corynebacterium otitidis ATCC 51513]CCI83703.1 adenosine deaminase [Corynebacterium otitidis ATCC 51513]